MKTPEISKQGSVWAQSCIKQLRKTISFYPLGSSLTWYIQHDWEKTFNLEVSSLEGKEESITYIQHSPFSGARGWLFKGLFLSPFTRRTQIEQEYFGYLGTQYKRQLAVLMQGQRTCSTADRSLREGELLSSPKRNWQISPTGKLDLQAQRRHPQKNFKRLWESLSRLIGEGLALYEASL